MRADSVLVKPESLRIKVKTRGQMQSDPAGDTVTPKRRHTDKDVS